MKCPLQSYRHYVCFAFLFFPYEGKLFKFSWEWKARVKPTLMWQLCGRKGDEREQSFKRIWRKVRKEQSGVVTRPKQGWQGFSDAQKNLNCHGITMLLSGGSYDDRSGDGAKYFSLRNQGVLWAGSQQPSLPLTWNPWFNHQLQLQCSESITWFLPCSLLSVSKGRLQLRFLRN